MMGSSTSQTEPETIQVSPKYWCYGCEAEIQNITSEARCSQCSSSAIQQITSENDPRTYDIVTVQSENNEPQPQQPIVTNPNPNPNNLTNVSFNNGTLRITLLNQSNQIWERWNNNLQNLFAMMAQNGQQQNKATAEQLSLLDIAQVEQCLICQEEGGEGLKLGCGHTFHNHCILPWLDRKNNCPTCRVVLKTQ